MSDTACRESEAMMRASAAALAGRTVEVDAAGLHYRELNRRLQALAEGGAMEIVVRNVCGQRYLGTSVRAAVRLIIDGVPGNDLGAFMDGPQVHVLQSAQDGCGNTMNAGFLVIHGSAGDIVGHSMRGGSIFVRDSVGYRVGIHMKEFGETRPVIVIGGTAQHFLGEYMAGGILIVLGRNLRPGESHPSRHLGTGMHGGVIYLRGSVDRDCLGREVGIAPLQAGDEALLSQHVAAFGQHFGVDTSALLAEPFTKLVPLTARPYGRLYAY